MQVAAASSGADSPKKRARHYSYNEGVNEPGKLLEEEAVEIQHETPAEDTDPVERFGPGGKSDPPVFEE